MSRTRGSVLIALFAMTVVVCRAQMATPDPIPKLTYPPIARVAHIQGDVVVNFRQTPDGRAVDVTPVSGPTTLQRVAVENVRAWHFEPQIGLAERTSTVTFHFQLNPPEGGYGDGSPVTTAVLDAPGHVQVNSVSIAGLERSECPSASDLVPPVNVMDGDFVELQRWNEEVRIDATGQVSWKQGKVSQSGQVSLAEAKSLLDRFRTPAVWSLCGHYDQAGLEDGGYSAFKVHIGGRDKSVSEYGDSAPAIFGEVEVAVDEAANTHRWRHGDPKTESIVEITSEYLPKPGKTKLMDAAQNGDKKAYLAALASGDTLTDVDASGWTPLMYAASSEGDSPVREMLKAGVNVNARSKRGETALMASAVTGMADEDLLKAGAEVNAVNDAGMTALMLLVQSGDPKEIEILLRAGADARKRDLAGRTALDYLNAANCGDQIIQGRDPRWMTTGYSRCNALDHDDYQNSRRLLVDAGAKTTRRAVPNAPRAQGH